MSNRNPEVTFNPAQLKYLEGMFPAMVHAHTSTVEQMRHYFGSQAVLEVIRSKTRGSTTHDIPTVR